MLYHPIYTLSSIHFHIPLSCFYGCASILLFKAKCIHLFIRFHHLSFTQGNYFINFSPFSFKIYPESNYFSPLPFLLLSSSCLHYCPPKVYSPPKCQSGNVKIWVILWTVQQLSIPPRLFLWVYKDALISPTHSSIFLTLLFFCQTLPYFYPFYRNNHWKGSQLFWS